MDISNVDTTNWLNTDIRRSKHKPVPDSITMALLPLLHVATGAKLFSGHTANSHAFAVIGLCVAQPSTSAH